VADTDYTETARKIRTSAILALLAGGNGDARVEIIDHDGSLERSYFGSCSAVGIREAKAELERREALLIDALAAEIDRRIPIPEGP
jgi:hypothetical protein